LSCIIFAKEEDDPMRVSRDQMLQNRERILAEAARLFRERGLEQVGVADVMKAAGLTHGGFYGHFKSKDDLLAQAAGEASRQGGELWRTLGNGKGQGALDAIRDFYLSPGHCDDPGSGCVVAALGSELARQPAAVRTRLTEGLKRAVETLQGLVAGPSPAARRRKAIAAYAGWIGAVVLARMADDPAFSKEILAAVAAEGPAAS
jgi:TetR/AcrR family transcriptional repressor of nem operon